MNSLKLKENICRICLQQNAILNWNKKIVDSYGLSYKDCYYKYTKLKESDSDCYPTSLCERCANEIKNAHMLFEKALESFNILRVALTVKKSGNDSDIEESCFRQKMQYQIDTLEECQTIELKLNSPLDDKTLIEIEDQVHLSPVYDNETLTDTENLKSGHNEVTISGDVGETRHFIDIKNFESSAENPLEQHLTEYSNIKLPKLSVIKKTNETRSKYELDDTKSHNSRKSEEFLPEISLEQFSRSCDTETQMSSVIEKPDNERDEYKSPASLLVDHTLSESCATKSSVFKSYKRSKPREKLCQYCSLKVNGTNHLKAHEATHCEDRERKETCPQCGVKLYTKLALKEHMKIHDENRKKNHKCEFCEKAFFNKGALNVHRRKHLGLMVKCQICSKEYCRQIDLNKHLLKHSATPLEKNVEKLKYTVQCQYCNKSVYTNQWKAHKAAHLNQPQMKCKICDKIFFSRTSCTAHIKKTHRKREYNEFIYYYVSSNSRMSHLIITQQEKVQPLTK